MAESLPPNTKGEDRGEALSRGFYSTQRFAYHMYESFQGISFHRWNESKKDATQIEWSKLAVAPLYRRALGLQE